VAGGLLADRQLKVVIQSSELSFGGVDRFVAVVWITHGVAGHVPLCPPCVSPPRDFRASGTRLKIPALIFSRGSPGRGATRRCVISSVVIRSQRVGRNASTWRPSPQPAISWGVERYCLLAAACSRPIPAPSHAAARGLQSSHGSACGGCSPLPPAVALACSCGEQGDAVDPGVVPEKPMTSHADLAARGGSRDSLIKKVKCSQPFIAGGSE